MESSFIEAIINIVAIQALLVLAVLSWTGVLHLTSYQLIFASVCGCIAIFLDCIFAIFIVQIIRRKM